MSKRIALVGHCGIDGPRLQRELSSLGDVSRVNSTGDLEKSIDEGVDLLLVNREPVGFDESGLDLVKQVRSARPEAKVMLVSDYPDAQEEAVQAGALPGFGKGQMGSPGLKEHVQRALEGQAAS